MHVFERYVWDRSKVDFVASVDPACLRGYRGGCLARLYATAPSYVGGESSMISVWQRMGNNPLAERRSLDDLSPVVAQRCKPAPSFGQIDQGWQ